MALALGYVPAIPIYAISSGPSDVSASIGAGLLLAVNVALLVLDARIFVTLDGWVHWSRLGTWARVGMVLLFCAGWFVPPIVLWRLTVRAYRARQAELVSLPARIAALERQLGTDGSHSREDAEHEP